MNPSNFEMGLNIFPATGEESQGADWGKRERRYDGRLLKFRFHVET